MAAIFLGLSVLKLHLYIWDEEWQIYFKEEEGELFFG